MQQRIPHAVIQFIVPGGLGQRLACREDAVDAELRQILEAVAASGPATRAELRDLVERRGGRFSGRAVADAIRKGLIRPFSAPGEAVTAPDLEARITADEAYVLTREGAVALGLDKDAYP